MKKGKFILKGFGWAAIGALFFSLMGFAVMTLWNWLIPDLFGGATVTFLQAIGLIVLAKLLTGFGGWGRHKGWGGYGHRSSYWKQKWESKMANMTPEEREKFKTMYYDRCGWKSYSEEKKDGDVATG